MPGVLLYMRTACGAGQRFSGAAVQSYDVFSRSFPSGKTIQPQKWALPIIRWCHCIRSGTAGGAVSSNAAEKPASELPVVTILSDGYFGQCLLTFVISDTWRFVERLRKSKELPAAVRQFFTAFPQRVEVYFCRVNACCGRSVYRSDIFIMMLRRHCLCWDRGRYRLISHHLGCCSREWPGFWIEASELVKNGWRRCGFGVIFYGLFTEISVFSEKP